MQARKAAGVGARSKVEILAAEQDMYVSRTTGEHLAGTLMLQVKASSISYIQTWQPTILPYSELFQSKCLDTRQLQDM